MARTADSPKYSHDEFRTVLERQFIKDAIRDAALSAFVYRLAPTDRNYFIDRDYIRLGKVNNDRAKFIKEAEEELLWNLHLDPEGLISEITEGRSSSDVVNLTDVDVEEEMKRLRPEIEEWYDRCDRWDYDGARWKRREEEKYEDGAEDEEEDDEGAVQDEINDVDNNKTARGVAEQEKAVASEDFLPLANTYSAASLGVPSYYLWPSFANAAASCRSLALLKDLSSAVHGAKASTSAFICSGHIPITTGYDDGKPTSTPVVIHWHTQRYQRGSASKITFPPQTSAQEGEGNAALMDRLVNDAQPATFGYGGEDVLDEKYRRAKKLGPFQFTTNFHPTDYGILDDITEVLLPNVLMRNNRLQDPDLQEAELQMRGVRAELWSLNIYSGPSGKFRSHVDTPRSPDQFGSLVICLPFPYKAGQLVVRHDGSTRTLDWGQEKPATIEWAAFYSDCEHEILEVTDGHRVTLTYNLYISNSVGRLISRNPTLDVKELPLFDSVKNLLRDKDFLPSGGVLGFCCAHQYAHTNSSSTIRIPHVLKGMDMALYAVFRALGLRLDVLPVLAQSLGYGIDLGGIDYTETQVVPWEFKESKERKRLETFRQMGYSLEWQEGLESKKRRIDELKLKYDDSASDPSLDFRKRLATLLYTRRIIGVESKVEEAIVGSTLWEQTITDEGGDETDDTDALEREYWPHNLIKKIHWVTPPYHKELNLAHLAYGNQPALETLYTYAALLVIVPQWSKSRGDVA